MSNQKLTVELDLSIPLHRKVARRLGYAIPFAKRKQKYGTRHDLEAALDKSSGCWLWVRAKNKYGYGTFIYARKTRFAHRAMYEFCHGPIPKGLVVMHSCDNPACCNPDHLSVGTHAENKADSVRKGRHQHGEKSAKAKLTDEQVRRILKEGRSEHGSQRRLAREFGVHPTTINTILRGVNWRHLA